LRRSIPNDDRCDPRLAWSARADAYADFFNRRWLDYTGLSAEQAPDWDWTVALHSDDLNGLVDYWRSVLVSGEPGEIEARLRRFDAVFRWFLFLCDSVVRQRWKGCQMVWMEMTVKGDSLEFILEVLCRVVEQAASGCFCSVILIDPSGSKIQQAVAPSLPSSYKDRFPPLPVVNVGQQHVQAGDTNFCVSARRNRALGLSGLLASSEAGQQRLKMISIVMALKIRKFSPLETISNTKEKMKMSNRDKEPVLQGNHWGNTP
jgi:hypothetical protein